MTKKERERSYEHYKQWQENKIRYRNESIAYVLLFGVGLFFIAKSMHKILLGAGIALVIATVYLLFMQVRKWVEMRKALSDIRKMAIEMGAEDVVIDTTSNSISFVMSSENTDKSMKQIEENLKNKGLKMNMKIQNQEKENVDNKSNMAQKMKKKRKTTEIGYVNENKQKNLGRTDKQGTDHNQYFYEMECLKCGHKYYANGSDIWQRKCPACQGGNP